MDHAVGQDEVEGFNGVVVRDSTVGRGRTCYSMCCAVDKTLLEVGEEMPGLLERGHCCFDARCMTLSGPDLTVFLSALEISFRSCASPRTERRVAYCSGGGIARYVPLVPELRSPSGRLVDQDLGTRWSSESRARTAVKEKESRLRTLGSML